jgi:sulfate adenylyltransferase (ADP) / ATP adenylyltransferase
MTQSPPQLQPGTLLTAIEQRTREALATAALLPIETDQTVVEEGGVRFLVRSVSNLERKAEERRRMAVAPQPGNPFLPPEPSLTVGAIGDGHLAVLNKFNVLDRHLLLVTRAFEHQERLLTEADFAALWACLGEFPSLGFYNGGRVAGASQPHKHLQLVPLPLAPGAAELPISPLIDSVSRAGRLGDHPALPFRNAFVPIHSDLPREPRQAAVELHDLYEEMLGFVGIGELEQEGEMRQSMPYNLLVTRRWMLLVPRRQETCQGISVNALGFAGSLFVRNEAEMAVVRSVGPLQLLKQVVMGE